MASLTGNSIQNLFNVNGLVAVITGGGSGLGLFAARALDANGAKAVYIIGRRESTLRAAAATAINRSIIPIVADVTDKQSLSEAAEKIRQEQGYINLFYANAGVSGPGILENLPPTTTDPTKPSVQEIQEALWKPEMQSFTNVLNVNVTATLYGIVAFLDLLAAGNAKGNIAQDSQVLITSSVLGSSRHLSLNQSLSYALSKTAATQLALLLATKFSQGGYRIRVNVVAPALFPTEMTDTKMQELKEVRLSSVRSAEPQVQLVPARQLPHELNPTERTGSEEDFAGIILFAASKAGAYLNGNILLADGGHLSVVPSA